MSFKPLFSTSIGLQSLEKGKVFTKSDGRLPANPKLYSVLNFIAVNAEAFDKNCQINVEYIGEETVFRLSDLGPPTEVGDIEMLTALIYRFVCEFDLSVRQTLPDIESFIKSVKRNLTQFHEEARTQIEYAQQEMALFMIKRIVNTDDFGSLRNISAIAAQVESKIAGWNKNLDETEKKATRLGETLQEHTQSFNFVGLQKGFSNLADEIKKELRAAQIAMVFFGVLVLAPASTELSLVALGTIYVTIIPITKLIAIGLATVAITLLLLYFFRISLRKADSCRAQLIQVRLRMSLCQFIQSYADYSSEFKTKNEGALAKFESLIFSGIVSSDEKLPSSFDGIEQLASLAKSITGKS